MRKPAGLLSTQAVRPARGHRSARRGSCRACSSTTLSWNFVEPFVRAFEPTGPCHVGVARVAAEACPDRTCRQPITSTYLNPWMALNVRLVGLWAVAGGGCTGRSLLRPLADGYRVRSARALLRRGKVISVPAAPWAVKRARPEIFCPKSQMVRPVGVVSTSTTRGRSVDSAEWPCVIGDETVANRGEFDRRTPRTVVEAWRRPVRGRLRCDEVLRPSY